MGKPWAAYSWLFEVLISGLFTRLGLIGLLVYIYTLMLAITVALHTLVRKFESRLAYSVALTALALFALTPFYMPRPWLFTILLFIIELNILVNVRHSGNYRALLLLLPLYAIWANVHIQFIYGLFVLGVAAIEDPISRLLGDRTGPDEERDRPIPARTMVPVIGARLVAILVNPYHFKIYVILWDTFRLSGLYDLVSELQALQFRSIPDWLVLLLTLAAAYALGRRRTFSPFWALLFLAGVFLSFRSGRDSWFAVILAVAVFPYARAGVPIARQTLSKVEVFIVVLTVGILLLTAIRIAPVSEANLQSIVARTFPMEAAQIVEKRGYHGPLYNHFDWGGYLIWRLPLLPVSIDGRSHLHDPARITHSLDVWGGRHDWASDPELAMAHVVIAGKDFPLTQLLRSDPF